MRQQIRSVETLFPLLAEGGVYIVEDCHTSYWAPYADPSDPAATFVAWVKDRIDDLHAYHHSTELDLATPWQTDLSAVHAYDSVVVLDKARRQAPFSEVSGTSDYINVDREASAANVELLATRQAALDRARRVDEDAARRVEDAERRLAEAEEASHEEVRILRAELIAAGQNAARARAELDSTTGGAGGHELEAPGKLGDPPGDATKPFVAGDGSAPGSQVAHPTAMRALFRRQGARGPRVLDANGSSVSVEGDDDLAAGDGPRTGRRPCALVRVPAPDASP